MTASPQRTDRTVDQIQQRLVDYACALTYDSLTPEAVHAAKVRVIDTLGALLGGPADQPDVDVGVLVDPDVPAVVGAALGDMGTVGHRGGVLLDDRAQLGLRQLATGAGDGKERAHPVMMAQTLVSLLDYIVDACTVVFEKWGPAPLGLGGLARGAGVRTASGRWEHPPGCCS